jgi:hypothetical protein
VRDICDDSAKHVPFEDYCSEDEKRLGSIKHPVGHGCCAHEGGKNETNDAGQTKHRRELRHQHESLRNPPAIEPFSIRAILSDFLLIL